VQNSGAGHYRVRAPHMTVHSNVSLPSVPHVHGTHELSWLTIKKKEHERDRLVLNDMRKEKQRPGFCTRTYRMKKTHQSHFQLLLHRMLIL